MKFGFNRPSEERYLKILTYIIQTTEAYLSYKLPSEPKGSSELINGVNTRWESK